MTWTLFGRPAKSGAAKLLIILMLIILLPATLPFHIIKWFFDGKGYIVYKNGIWMYEPDRVSCTLSLIFVIALLIIIL